MGPETRKTIHERRLAKNAWLIKAMFYEERHFLSHSMQLADALIGTTVISYGFPMLTGNDKHYKVMKDLEIIKFMP